MQDSVTLTKPNYTIPGRHIYLRSDYPSKYDHIRSTSHVIWTSIRNNTC